MAADTTVTLRGEGGVEWDFSLPLSEAIQDQVFSGVLVAADEESADLLAEHLDADVVADDGDEAEGVEVHASDAAVALAEENGIDLSEVEGTGKDGTIKVGDVRTAIDAADDGDEADNE